MSIEAIVVQLHNLSNDTLRLLAEGGYSISADPGLLIFTRPVARPEPAPPAPAASGEEGA